MTFMSRIEFYKEKYFFWYVLDTLLLGFVLGLVGNIANGSPIADISPAFIALGASLKLNYMGNKRVIPINAFFIAYGKQDLKKGEFVESVHVPKLQKNHKFQCYKVSRRFDQDISAVMGAFLLSISDDGLIEKAQREQLSHVYLGYWIKDSQKMEYKINYKPLELYINGIWITVA